MRISTQIIWAALVLLSAASVIGIDFGVDWFKVSIVKQGIPLDIVLNKETKRKTTSTLTIHMAARLFGSTKYPAKTYPALKNLLGQHFPDIRALQYRSLYNNNMLPNDGISFGIEGQEYRVEHLVAMVLQHAKHQAEAHGGGELVTGVVLTVPPYFNQFERQALLDAADLANIRVFNLINDETAVALNYAMLRKFTNTTQHHIFFDMGAGSTVASLITFKTVDVKEGKRIKSVSQIQVLGTGYDDTLGGTAIDQRMYSILLAGFTSKNNINADDFKQDSFAVSRLLREANRVKQVLSANSETFAGVESLYDNIDFKFKIKREDLEAACKLEMARVVKPIKDIIAQSGLRISEIDSLVLVGGGVRSPMVQKAIGDYFGESKIARNVNGDEAAVLGAGFRAAGLSPAFRVREILVKDKNIFDVEIHHAVEASGIIFIILLILVLERTLKTLIFTSNTLLGSKKLMSFQRETDFNFTVAYRASGIPMFTVSVVGVDAAFKNISLSKRTILKGPVVKATLILDNSGLISVGDVFVYAELGKSMGDSIKDSVLSFFGQGEKAKDEEEATTEAIEKKNATSAQNSTTQESQGVLFEQIQLNISVRAENIAPLSDEERRDIKARIYAMDERDAGIRAQEEALNNLESLVYQVKYAIEDDDIVQVTTEAHRDTLSKQAILLQEWMEENTHEKSQVIKDQQATLDILWKPVSIRRKEIIERPVAVERLLKSLVDTRALVSEHFANQTKNEESDLKIYMEIPKKEIDTFETRIVNIEQWIKGVIEKQMSKTLVDDPAFLSSDVVKEEAMLKKWFDMLIKSKKWKYVTVEIPDTAKSGKKDSKSEKGPVKSDDTTDDPVKEETIPEKDTSESTTGDEQTDDTKAADPDSSSDTAAPEAEPEEIPEVDDQNRDEL